MAAAVQDVAPVHLRMLFQVRTHCLSSFAGFAVSSCLPLTDPWNTALVDQVLIAGGLTAVIRFCDGRHKCYCLVAAYMAGSSTVTLPMHAVLQRQGCRQGMPAPPGGVLPVHV